MRLPLKSEAVIAGAIAVAVAFVAVVPTVVGCGSARQLTDPKKVMDAAMEAQAGLKSVKMEMDSDLDLNMEGGQKSTSTSYEGSYEAPDRWRLTLRSPSGKYEIIIVGERTFLKTPGADAWTEKKGDYIAGATPPGEVIDSKYLESASEIELIDSKGESYHLGFNLDMGEYAKSLGLTGVDPALLGGKKAHMEVWVLKDSFYISKATMEFASRIGVAESSGSVEDNTLHMSMEIEFSGFDEPVSIEAPEAGMP